MTVWRQRLGAAFESSIMHGIIGTLIILNMILLGLETSGDIARIFGNFFSVINQIILGVFIIEITARVLAHGISFFKDPWHVFDFLIVAVALSTYGGFFLIFRVVRVIWILRFVTLIPQFQHLVDSIAHAIPHLLSVGFFLLLAIYAFGVIGTMQYGASNPTLFGDLGTSMATLSQMLLLPPLWLRTFDAISQFHATAWLFIFPALILLNYLLLQLVLGIILSALRTESEKSQAKSTFKLLEKLRHSRGKSELEAEELPHDLEIIIHRIDDVSQEIKELKQRGP